MDNRLNRVWVIRQGWILFKGSIRFSLEPFDDHSDEALLEALRLSHVLPGLEKQTFEIWQRVTLIVF